MSVHEQIVTDIQKIVDASADVVVVTPASIAQQCFCAYIGGPVDARIEYVSLEHLKQIARMILRRRFHADSDGNEVMQGELFSGHLQRRYPLPHAADEVPGYKLLEHMTDPELIWNEDMLGRSAEARLLHKDALRAYRLSRKAA